MKPRPGKKKKKHRRKNGTFSLFLYVFSSLFSICSTCVQQEASTYCSVIDSYLIILKFIHQIFTDIWYIPYDISQALCWRSGIWQLIRDIRPLLYCNWQSNEGKISKTGIFHTPSSFLIHLFPLLSTSSFHLISSVFINLLCRLQPFPPSFPIRKLFFPFLFFIHHSDFIKSHSFKSLLW